MSHRPGQAADYARWALYNPRSGDWIGDTKDILLRFLKDLFYQMPADLGEDRGLFHYDPDSSVSSLVISDSPRIATASLERRPALLISRGSLQYSDTSLDHLRSLSFKTAERTHTDLVSGSLSINCLSREGIEAERLAMLCARAVRTYSRQLQKAGFFKVGHGVVVGSETSPGALLQGDNVSDFTLVTVSFPFLYQDQWTVSPQALLLRELRVRLVAVSRVVAGGEFPVGTFLQDGTVNPEHPDVIINSWTFQSEEDP